MNLDAFEVASRLGIAQEAGLLLSGQFPDVHFRTYCKN
jgi:hypothetical protein